MDPDTQVYFTNCVPVLPQGGDFPSSKRGGALLKQWASNLDEELSHLTHAKVIVACGGPALARLTGYVEKSGGWGIEKWRGSVLHNKDVPDVHNWHGHKWVAHLPPNVCIIPVLHPAGILRTKSRDTMQVFRKDVQKVARAVKGELQQLEYSLKVNPTVRQLERHFEGAKYLFFDTEFHKESKELYWVGLTCDGYNIFGMQWSHEYAPLLLQMFKSEGVIKAAHNIVEDVEVLERRGVEVRGEWWDTMIGFHALHPSKDLRVALHYAAAYYLDDVKYWKGMDRRSPLYNALDVLYGWHVMLAEFDEARGRPVGIEDELRTRMKLLRVTKAMRGRGMLVDATTRATLVKFVEDEVTALHTRIADEVRPLWDMRVRTTLEELRDVSKTVQLLQDVGRHGRCERHPSNNVLRHVVPKCETCAAAHGNAEAARLEYTTNKKIQARLTTLAGRWEGGFQATNAEHLRWLLYDKGALNLPRQVDFKTRRVTSSSDAIDKLEKLVATRRKPQSFEVVRHIKRAQQLAKALSTFLYLVKDGQSLIDDEGYVHPPYKVHGTETGRLASGEDDEDEKSDNRYSFNALNIPEQWRRMYVAPPGCTLVAADWRNVEGRLTAHFCRDPAYVSALQNELQGGPKIHALNAAIIYGIDPQDAHTHMVQMGGHTREAYDAGKRLTHAWSYGMGPRTAMKHFNISLKEAQQVDEKLSAAYPMLVQWRKRLVEQVLGVWKREFTNKGSKVVCLKEGTRYLANPFGWQKYWWGVEASQANEVTAFLPQSTGQSMWSRCAIVLEQTYPIYTGTYDSFVLIAGDTGSEVDEACIQLQTIMQHRWEELDDKTFPCEVKVGWNWGRCEKDNPRGLKAV